MSEWMRATRPGLMVGEVWTVPIVCAYEWPEDRSRLGSNVYGE